jgi:hypothetical protein
MAINGKLGKNPHLITIEVTETPVTSADLHELTELTLPFHEVTQIEIYTRKFGDVIQIGRIWIKDRTPDGGMYAPTAEEKIVPKTFSFKEKPKPPTLAERKEMDAQRIEHEKRNCYGWGRGKTPEGEVTFDPNYYGFFSEEKKEELQNAGILSEI